MCSGAMVQERASLSLASPCPTCTKVRRVHRRIGLGVPLVAFAVALGMCLQQILWAAMAHLGSSPTHPPPQHLEPASADHHERIMRNAARLQDPPSEIYVLGERNSGTNFAAKVLRRAFDPPNSVDPSRTHEYFSSNIPVLRHKHMFRHSLLNNEELADITRRTDILWVLAVRSPCEWAEAMKRLPWHMCHPTKRNKIYTEQHFVRNNITSECPGEFIGFEHQEEMRNYTLSEFFEMEWGDWPESSNFRNLSFVTKDFIYRDVFQLRQHKLLLMKQIIDAVPRNVKIVRLHELERSPETFVQNLVLEFNLKLKQGYQPQRPSDKIHSEICLSDREWQLAQSKIDWIVEGHFGYNFLDCHRCYGRKRRGSKGMKEGRRNKAIHSNR